MAGEASGTFVTLRREGAVATITLHRPKVNALSTALVRELGAILEALHVDPPGAVVLSGGRQLFSAGVEISELRHHDSRAELLRAIDETFARLAGLPRVTIAALHGVAFGGGLELALACDLRLAADDVRLALPEVALGLFPGAGGTQRLPRLVGGSVAKGLIFTGREIGAEEARAIGLVDAIHAADGLLAAAQELAARMAAGPLVALALAKQSIDSGLDLGLAEGLALERQLLEGAFATEDAQRGIDSFFTAGPGRASFSGR